MAMPNETASSNPNSTNSNQFLNKQGKVFKVVVIGDSNVGKTTLTYRFCEGRFLELSEATIGVDFRSRTVNIDGEDITLQLWDTAGQERYRMSMIRHYYRNTHAIVFVYDVTSMTSFVALNKWVEEARQHCLLDIPRILVGNKCDGNATVSTTAAQQFADQNNMPLFETSARLDSQCDNVEAIFLTLAHKLKNQKPFLPPPLSVKVTRQATHRADKESSWCC